jgi:hypothetical protein
MLSLARLRAAGEADFDTLLAPSAARSLYQDYKGEPNTPDRICALGAARRCPRGQLATRPNVPTVRWQVVSEAEDLFAAFATPILGTPFLRVMWSQTSASETCTTNVTANDTIESVAMILWLD